MSVRVGDRKEGELQVRMDRKKISRERKKLVKIREKELAGEIPEGTSYESYQAWMANAKRGNTRREQNAMTAYYKAITGGKADGKGKLP